MSKKTKYKTVDEDERTKLANIRKDASLDTNDDVGNTTDSNATSGDVRGSSNCRSSEGGGEGAEGDGSGESKGLEGEHYEKSVGRVGSE